MNIKATIYCSPGRLTLQATIFTLSADMFSCSNLKFGCSTIKVHTSSQKRYVCKWPYKHKQSKLYKQSIFFFFFLVTLMVALFLTICDNVSEMLLSKVINTRIAS